MCSWCKVVVMCKVVVSDVIYQRFLLRFLINATSNICFFFILSNVCHRLSSACHTLAIASALDGVRAFDALLSYIGTNGIFVTNMGRKPLGCLWIRARWFLVVGNTGTGSLGPRNGRASVAILVALRSLYLRLLVRRLTIYGVDRDDAQLHTRFSKEAWSFTWANLGGISRYYICGAYFQSNSLRRF